MAEEEEEMLEEEFSVWKKNTPFLYDLLLSHPLQWPSLTVHFFPSSPTPHSSFNLHKLLFATHTADHVPNFLIIADALLPSSNSQPDPHNPIIPNIQVTHKIPLDGEVNRARSMPQNSTIIGVKTCSSDVYVFDTSKQLSNEGLQCDPHFRLKGHDKEGYGLSWSPFKEGHLLSASYDHKICLWDVSAPQHNVLHAHHTYQAHESVVNDVSWHLRDDNIFGSVGDDSKLIIWDFRTNQPQNSLIAHDKEVNFLSFNPYNEWVLATASSDSTIGLFDTRKLTLPLHVLSSHTDEVFQVEWDPNHETVLASSGADRRIMVWDLNRVGDEQLEGDGDDGPPELLFSHGGHKGKISDFSWNKNQPWVISSVAEDNSFHVWKMAESIYGDGDGEDDEMWTVDEQY
ncbi:hypothetical protein Lal_00004647 [Lupinus albus]|uniref:Putative transcription factor WD40-like family n=1 Tax=Lupinus albus TaxID=3870 RepID=A0A6A5LZJ0_LUPAL|nr:putative transcription factor WD40-like family [Lupinus albus]KAF1865273.1 hypothetical protein Lal_00004647 [Lupinus albus]